MGKRKHARRENKKQNEFLTKQRSLDDGGKGSSKKTNVVLSDDFDGVLHDEVGQFDADKDQIFFNQKDAMYNDQNDGEEEQEVYSLDGVDSESDEEDDQDAEQSYGEDDDQNEEESENEGSESELDMASDLEDMSPEEGDEDEGMLRSSKSWGKKSSAYYGSDYQRREGKSREQADKLEDEEEEAAMAHKRHLMTQLNEFDFEIDAFKDKISDEQTDSEIGNELGSVHIKPSLVTLDEKIASLKLRNPELEYMIEEFNSLNEELASEVKPKLCKITDSTQLTIKHRIVQFKFVAYTHYLMCLSFYFMLKLNKESTENHPVMERLLEFRQYISKIRKLEEAPDNKIVERAIMEDINGLLEKGYRLDVAENNDNETKESSLNDLHQQLMLFQATKKAEAKQLSKALEESQNKRTPRFKNSHSVENESKLLVEKDGVSKRKVSKPIKVNKSVVEIKLKQLRKEKNPRSKNRKKSLVANIKRKGQVRPMRDASVNYMGESTGINKQVKRGTKLT